MCKLRFWSLAGAAVVALGLAAGLGFAGPALAADDGSPLYSIFSMFGAQPPGQQDAAINYQPRPPLVVPPKRDLPQPQAKAPHGAEWPNDPDVAARLRAEADSRRPAPLASMPPPPGAPETVYVKMKDDCLKDNVTCTTDDSFWDKMKNAFSGGNKEVVLKGTEPNRDYLVDPPLGYRRPLAVPTKAPAQPNKEAKSNDPATTTQPKEANLRTADTPPPPPQEPPKEHFGLW